MSTTIVERLAEFSANTQFNALPAEVIEECKRDILDSIGVAVAGIDHPKGRMGIEGGRRVGGTNGTATIIGTGEKSTIFGAAFANGELISALDADSVLLPGHVSPYVLPGAFAISETRQSSGKDLIAAVSVSHEMSYRFGAAMSTNRDSKDGKAATAKVLGYSSTVFGATAAAAKLKGLPAAKIANALGIAAAITPVNAHRAWLQHAPAATIKYLLAGALTNAALSAAEMGELGHRGDVQMLDDSEFGYPRFIGTARWAPENLTEALGSEWRFLAHQLYKPYPHCRVMHAPLDLLIDLVAKNDIKVAEIESIKVFGEGWAYVLPTFLSRDIQQVQDAQFCFAHGIALAAHRIPPSAKWQDESVVFDPSVMGLMNKVTLEIHPTYFESIAANPKSRPSRVEISARGQTFAAEKRFPKGTPSPDADSFMTTDELVRKFRTFVDGFLPAAAIDSVVDGVLNLEKVADFGSIMRQLVRR
ncbi:MAG TPA: MmgE/PrpD family protein [Ramlibacter sp.]|nr:MmgE/PrpD family protein [Ramlibacter sp.]